MNQCQTAASGSGVEEERNSFVEKKNLPTGTLCSQDWLPWIPSEYVTCESEFKLPFFPELESQSFYHPTVINVCTKPAVWKTATN